jgi:multiple sugar transport system substrate-binding protein
MTHVTHQSTRRRVLKMSSAALAAAGIGVNAFAQEKQITIISDKSNPATRATLASIAAAFEKESGIKVVINNMDHEAHKTAIRNYLVASPPDLCFWFSGNRMRSFVERGLFDDVSDLYAKEKLFDVFGVSAGAVTVNGKQWGLPMNGTPWGLMYRKDVFAEKGLTVPKTLAEFKTMAEKAKAAGLVPLAMGAKDKWPVAGFFDHLNLRINGLDKHMALMNGNIAYTHPMLTAVFDRWEEMIKAGYFQANATSYGWQEAGALIVPRKRSQPSRFCSIPTNGQWNGAI